MSYNFSEEVRFCPHCGQRAVEREVFGRPRPHCPACRTTFFQDPKLAVVVVIDDGGALVLQRRAVNPGRGRWSFPSGYVERGELVEDAARREVLEETGLDVGLVGLLGLYSEAGNPVVVAAYLATPLAGELTISDESLELSRFPHQELPSLAFPHDAAIIQAWLDWRARETIG